MIGPGQEGWRWAIIGNREDCPMALRLAGQVDVKKCSFHVFYGVGRLPCSCLTAVGISFRPGPVGLRDSWNAGPRAWRQANAISPISDLPVQIPKFEEAQLALPDCKEKRLRRVMGRWR